MEGALPVIAIVKKAGLMEDQEQQVAEILRTHKAALEQKAARAAEARRVVIGQLTADTVDSAALAAAMDQAAAAGKELVMEWAQVRREVQAMLTPEQIAELQALRDKFLKRVDERSAAREQWRGERLDRWIERLSR
jgi:Spy/CpxP family protein refolding chaperone